jgi:hypothetical protein
MLGMMQHQGLKSDWSHPGSSLNAVTLAAAYANYNPQGMQQI